MTLSSVPNPPAVETSSGAQQHLSVVVPVYSGAAYLRDLCDGLIQLGDVLERLQVPITLSEILFVDDESVDGSSVVLRELEQELPMVTVVTMSRNFGQHAATIAGILHTTGDWVVTMDEDLQHPPALIPALLSTAVSNELDVVYGYPDGRIHSPSRDRASRIAKRIIAKVSGTDQLNLVSSFRVLRGSVARASAATASHQAYFDSVLSWFTTRAVRVGIDSTDHRTEAGEASGYSLRRLLGHAHRALTSGDMPVLRLIAGLGLVGVLGALILGGRFTLLWATGSLDREAIGWPSTFAAILFFGGIIATQLVVLTEYAISSALHLRGKPAYFAVDRSRDRALAAYFAAHPWELGDNGLRPGAETARRHAA